MFKNYLDISVHITNVCSETLYTNCWQTSRGWLQEHRVKLIQYFIVCCIAEHQEMGLPVGRKGVVCYLPRLVCWLENLQALAFQ